MGTNSISDAAVRGVSFGTSIPGTTSARTFLDHGNVAGLLAFRKAQFGGYRMEDDDDNDDANDDDTGDGDDDGNDDDDDGDKPDEKDKEIESLKAENKRRRLKAREQDTALKTLQKQVEALTKGKGKAKDEDDDGAADEQSEKVAELEGDREVLLTANESLRVENAFLQNTKHAWKNPKSALKLLDRSDIEINDDGEVEGLEDALDALAKSDPYLLAEADKDDDDDDEDEKPRRRRTTGQQTKPKSRSKGNPNRDSLIKKYPALNR